MDILKIGRRAGVDHPVASPLRGVVAATLLTLGSMGCTINLGDGPDPTPADGSTGELPGGTEAGNTTCSSDDGGIVDETGEPLPPVLDGEMCERLYEQGFFGNEAISCTVIPFDSAISQGTVDQAITQPASHPMWSIVEDEGSGTWVTGAEGEYWNDYGVVIGASSFEDDVSSGAGYGLENFDLNETDSIYYWNYLEDDVEGDCHPSGIPGIPYASSNMAIDGSEGIVELSRPSQVIHSFPGDIAGQERLAHVAEFFVATEPPEGYMELRVQTTLPDGCWNIVWKGSDVEDFVFAPYQLPGGEVQNGHSDFETFWAATGAAGVAVVKNY